MKFILISCLVVFSLASPGLDYYKKLLDDPIRWVDAPMPREILSDQNDALHIVDKSHPEFDEKYKEWKKKNFRIGEEDGLLGRSWQNDTAESWFNGQSFISDISKLPLNGTSKSEPWSSTYWPIQYGVLSIRYARNEKNTIVDGDGQRLNYRQSVSKYSEPEDYQNASKSDANIEEYISQYFSPSEKYDLLLGDLNFTLTNQNKQQGEVFVRDDDVESWMGICHGWAPAAFIYPRPQHDVIATAADGKTKIKFYADDIRGLASLKYASTRYENIFVGGRCNRYDRTIKKDPETGLILDYTCFDVNPATWTMVVANRLGVEGKSFVIDATFDLQVWNQPVYSYEMQFFNILNTTQESNLESAKVSIKELAASENKLHHFLTQHHDEKAVNVVGVNMELVYIAETSPSHQTPGKDKQVKVTYIYTLELDENNNIVGGEWLNNQHPDFLWAPADGVKAVNEEDELLEKKIQGTIKNPAVLQEITRYAVKASERGEVLNLVVDYLVEKSATGSEEATFLPF